MKDQRPLPDNKVVLNWWRGWSLIESANGPVDHHLRTIFVRNCQTDDKIVRRAKNSRKIIVSGKYPAEVGSAAGAGCARVDAVMLQIGICQ